MSFEIKNNQTLSRNRKIMPDCHWFGKHKPRKIHHPFSFCFMLIKTTKESKNRMPIGKHRDRYSVQLNFTRKIPYFF